MRPVSRTRLCWSTLTLSGLIDQFKDNPDSLSADERTDLIRTLVNESAEKQGGFGAWMNWLAENSGLQALNDALNFEGTFYTDEKIEKLIFPQTAN